MKKLISVLIVLAMLISGCSHTQKAAAGSGTGFPSKVVINDSGSYSNIVVAIIRNEKILEKYMPDTEIEWTNLAAGSDIRDGIVSNNITIGLYALPIFIMGQESGLPVKLVSAGAISPIKVYTNDDSKKDITDIMPEDRIAVVGLGSILHIAFLAALNDLGIDTSAYDNSFSVMPHADGLNNLRAKTGEINSLLLTFPTSVKADKDEAVKEVYDLTEICESYGIGTVAVTSKQVAEKYPEFVEAFKKAEAEAIELFNKDSSRIAEVLAGEWEIDPQIIIDTWNTTPPQLDIEGYDKQANLMYKMGLLEKEPVPYAEIIK